jgi:hypothetical protein
LGARIRGHGMGPVERMEKVVGGPRIATVDSSVEGLPAADDRPRRRTDPRAAPAREDRRRTYPQAVPGTRGRPRARRKRRPYPLKINVIYITIWL